MDHRAIKRPRTDSKSKPEATALATPKKKKKKSKSGKSKKLEDDKPKPKPKERESTATAEGQQMAQVMSTFNRLEQSRFEAFRKATFRGDAVSTYVSHCLQASHERAFARGEKTRQYLGGNELGVGDSNSKRVKEALQQCPYVVDGNNDKSSTNGSSSSQIHPPKRPLEDLVAPNQAEEIRVVVSTLAKAYAQRLITAARRVAVAQGQHDTEAILPKHVVQAHQSRVKVGLDPGFFLQQTPLSAERIVVGHSAAAAALGIPDRQQLQRDAALAAQEEYDKMKKEEKFEAEAEDNSKVEEEKSKVEEEKSKAEEEANKQTDATSIKEEDKASGQTMEDVLMEDLGDD